ncbi:hypothetical protein [Paenibacillus sp. MMS20-IR301]|uniref:hypothetical protein n=1 Tax=Paenibacillus sp. MMS20-IR301 TaxID=2895946 RepID=UPI0028ECC13E|nr:hypothetical protein [Paenibacillus sp. MMS20-IR301]WNS42535.1 hypothetical protein LOS79_26675 [Paenibacillus sp. MMS20-IR301]
MKSVTFFRYITPIALSGAGLGLLLFILTRSGVFELPIVIGTTSYEGMGSSLLLLVSPPVLLTLLGCVFYLFRKR